MDYFECLLANLRETSGRICIVGDFNMPSINWEYVIDLSNSTEGIKFCNLLGMSLGTLCLWTMTLTIVLPAGMTCFYHV